MQYSVYLVMKGGVPFVIDHPDSMGLPKLPPKRVSAKNERLPEYVRSYVASHGGTCSTGEVKDFLARAMRSAIRAVAGDKDTYNGRFVTDEEIDRVRDPFLRELVRSAAVCSNSTAIRGYVARSASHAYGEGDGDSDGPHGMPGPDDFSNWGPDGPSRGAGGDARYSDVDSGGRDARYWDVDSGRSSGGSASTWDVDSDSASGVLF